MQCLRTLSSARGRLHYVRPFANLPKKPLANTLPATFPDLLYFPRFFQWLSMKCKLKYLQRAWDNEFSEGAFIYGTTQAICRVTHIIHDGQLEQLHGLLTPTAQALLRNAALTPVQRNVIDLQPDDIKLLVPVSVQLVRDKDDGNARRAFVLLKSLAMKWYEDKQQRRKLVLIVIDAEFMREYDGTRKSEWFISLFNIVQCALIGTGSSSGEQ